MKETFGVILIIIFIIGLFVLVRLSINNEQESVSKWATDHNLGVQEVEGPNSFEIGPYWYQKHRHVYKLTTTTGVVYWIRTPSFFCSQDIYVETSPGQYQKIQ